MNNLIKILPLLKNREESENETKVMWIRDWLEMIYHKIIVVQISYIIETQVLKMGVEARTINNEQEIGER